MISRAAPEFWQLYRELPPKIQAAARSAYQLFSQNPAHPGLRLERLRFDPRAWSVRVTRDVRAVALRRGDEWLWFWIGTHKEFDRRFRVDSSRVERSDLRGGFEPQPLQPVANLFPSRAHRSSVSTLRAGCERLTRRRSTAA